MNKYSGNILLIIAVCGFCISSTGHAGQPHPYAAGPETIIIHAGSLLDVPGNPVKQQQTVVVKGGRIDSVHTGFLGKNEIEGNDD